jgi:hypothetical protein
MLGTGCLWQAGLVFINTGRGYTDYSMGFITQFDRA